MLVLAALLVLIGVTLALQGMAWLRAVQLPSNGPAAIADDEVVATLRDHQLLAFRAGPNVPHWALRRWLPDQLAELTWWRRDSVSRALRVFLQSCGFALVLTVCCLVLPQVMTDDLIGPFPLDFVILLPFVTAVWAVLGLMLIGSTGPRLESVELPLVNATEHGEPREQQIIERRPDRLERDPPTLALTLGISGVAAQCLMLGWWNLSPIDYSLRATTLVRHAGAIAGGVIFFLVGDRMVAAAAKLLLVLRYESLLFLIDTGDNGMIVRAAAIRTETLGLAGPRHIVAAVGGPHVRESAEALIRELVPPPSDAASRFARPRQPFTP
jgi:hypothetical protein